MNQRLLEKVLEHIRTLDPTMQPTDEMMHKLFDKLTLAEVEELHFWTKEKVVTTTLAGSIRHAQTSLWMHDVVCPYLMARKLKLAYNADQN